MIKSEKVFIEGDMTGNINSTSRRIKAAISMVIGWIPEKDTSKGGWFKIVSADRGGIRVANTFKVTVVIIGRLFAV